MHIEHNYGFFIIQISIQIFKDKKLNVYHWFKNPACCSIFPFTPKLEQTLHIFNSRGENVFLHRH